MRFHKVVGQTSLKKQLIDGVNAGRIPHAQLFLGKSGSGTLPMALAYAQYVSCLNRLESDSCGECSSCRKYETYTHPDLHFSFPYPTKVKDDLASDYMKEWRRALAINPYMNFEGWMQHMEAENKQGNIPIRELRSIIRGLSLKPFESEFKVLVLWLPEYMGQEGNVLLKIIEEPPQNTLFLLVGEKSDRILNTIISRTQPVRVPPIKTEDISSYLMREFEVDEVNCSRFALMSHGDLNLAKSLTQETENPYFQQWRNWMSICYTRKMGDAVKWADEMSGIGRETLKSFFLYGLEILRGIMVFGYSQQAGSWSAQEQDFIQKFSSLDIPISQLEKVILGIEDAISNIERNANAKMVLTDLSFVVARNLKK